MPARTNAYAHAPRGAFLLRSVLILVAAALLGACSGGPAATDRGANRMHRTQSENAAYDAHRVREPVWYVLHDGRFERFDATRNAMPELPFQKWTVQSRVAGFLEVGNALYTAVNKWGIVTMPVADLDPERAQVHENAAIFGGRTIDGIYDESGTVLLHLYRNTLFDTPPPITPPTAAVTLDATTGALKPLDLPRSQDGWEAVDVVHTDDGRWAMAWKKVTSEKVEFAYVLYSPALHQERAMTKNAFLASYAFHDIVKAPAGLRSIAVEAARTTGGQPVVHLIVHAENQSRTTRYHLGSETKLMAGDAGLLTVPVVETPAVYTALISDGTLLIAPAGATTSAGSGASAHAAANAGAAASAGVAPDIVHLPALPEGYVYTDLWTNGERIVASWEEQRFTDVGSAGIVIGTIPSD